MKSNNICYLDDLRLLILNLNDNKEIDFIVFLLRNDLMRPPKFMSFIIKLISKIFGIDPYDFWGRVLSQKDAKSIRVDIIESTIQHLLYGAFSSSGFSDDELSKIETKLHSYRI